MPELFRDGFERHGRTKGFMALTSTTRMTSAVQRLEGFVLIRKMILKNWHVTK
jgi:hypothetical protein